MSRARSTISAFVPKITRLHRPVRLAFFFALTYCISYAEFNRYRGPAISKRRPPGTGVSGAKLEDSNSPQPFPWEPHRPRRPD
jgi:hypothetical protein